MGSRLSKYVCSKCNGNQWVTSNTNLFSGSTCCGMKVVIRPSIRETNKINKARKDLERFSEKPINFGASNSKCCY